VATHDAVQPQVGVVIWVDVLLAILRKELRLPSSPQTMPQIPSVKIFV